MEQSNCSINDLPDVVLEYIFTLLSPYDELLNCRLVCKSWYQLTYCALHKIKLDFKLAIKNLNIQWSKYTSIDWPNISGRYSHSCCLHSQYMYVFGGCTIGNLTSSHPRSQATMCTTFNDLWIFDLNEKTWRKPLTSGHYPPPKSCVSMVSYRKKLYLFGGWTHSSAYPLNQEWKLFNDLHEFDIVESKWSLIEPDNEIKCPPMAGHSASVIGNKMLIYGGLLYSQGSNFNPICVNSDIYIYNFGTNKWSKKQIRNDADKPAPPPRYGHTQILLDEHSIAMIGGCSSPKVLHNDIWILKMEDEWHWIKVTIESNDALSAPIFGFHQAVKVDDMILFLSNICTSSNKISGLESKSRRVFRSNEGTLPISMDQIPSTSSHHARFKSQLKQDMPRKEFASMSQHDEESKLNDDKPAKSYTIQLNTVRTDHRHRPYNPMFLHVLDFSKVLTHYTASWLNQVRRYDGPDEIMLYSLIAATNELVLFGGIEKVTNNHNADRKQEINNSVYIASARNFII